ncbi:expressed unknown protein [Seminavis robusta]|uniref:Uncharacterized protein n=1 Tax=Seminavis robusta TaxID=568900 RepID=A0A9N8I0Y4_9STRA|nr:expressed unknown protein [Seminavis robusta]|eukprot:Sro2965_g341090.1 n/a (539) ;mRNA; f:5590-7851
MRCSVSRAAFLFQIWYLCSSGLCRTVAAELQLIRHRNVEQNNNEPSWGSWISGWTNRIGRRLTGDDASDYQPREGRYTDTGAEVFMISFSDEEVELAKSGSMEVLNNLTITRVTEMNGVNGNPRNRYIWSMALDDNDDLYVGILNQNFVPGNITGLLWSIVKAPWRKKFDALVDTLLRQWSGTPVFENQGAQIYYKPQDSPSFQLQLETSPDHLGFRKMVNYHGNIYAGSTNGPDGPYDGAPYDFSFYEQGTGAQIFTNAGNGSFAPLDDEGNLDSYDKSIRSMVVSSYSDRLFIGTETYECAKVLIYTDARPVDGSSQWKKIEMEGDDCTHSVSGFYDMGGGKILFGTWETWGYGVFLLDETNNDTLTRLNTPTYFQHIPCGVMEIRVFKGQLYIGILSFIRGFALIRTPKFDDLLNLNRGDWQLITGNGFAREQRQQMGGNMAGNEYPWTSAEINGIYFVGTVSLTPRGFSWTTGLAKLDQAQLWASVDGNTWQVVESELFDASRFMYGFRTMQVTKDQKKLYIGSAVNMYLPDER